MKTPGFWFTPPGLEARLLTPFSLLYQLAGRLRRQQAKPTFSPVPFILVGNVVAGGAGKTPVVCALTERLQARGLRVHLLAKGYGGRLKGPLRVDPTVHTAREVGDEPLLLARLAPTFIAKDRAAGLLAAAAGADVVIGDDGLQNPYIKAQLTLLVMDGVLGTGNGRLIPAGPLREPLVDALSRVDAVIQIGGPPRSYGNKPVLLADFHPYGTDWMQGARVIAFAGIGQPEKFFATCTTAGATLVQALPFPDHHPYSESEIRQLIALADREEAILVTTAKDAIRLPASLRDQIRVIEGKTGWRDENALTGLLDRLFAGYKEP